MNIDRFNRIAPIFVAFSLIFSACDKEGDSGLQELLEKNSRFQCEMRFTCLNEYYRFETLEECIFLYESSLDNIADAIHSHGACVTDYKEYLSCFINFQEEKKDIALLCDGSLALHYDWMNTCMDKIEGLFDCFEESMTPPPVSLEQSIEKKCQALHEESCELVGAYGDHDTVEECIEYESELYDSISESYQECSELYENNISCENNYMVTNKKIHHYCENDDDEGGTDTDFLEFNRQCYTHALRLSLCSLMNDAP